MGVYIYESWAFSDFISERFLSVLLTDKARSECLLPWFLAFYQNHKSMAGMFINSDCSIRVYVHCT